jgi:hypothetical protein
MSGVGKQHGAGVLGAAAGWFLARLIFIPQDAVCTSETSVHITDHTALYPRRWRHP